MNFFEFNNDYIDFHNSKILFEKITSENIYKEYLNITNLIDYELKIEELRDKKGCELKIEKISLNKDIIMKDFFMIKYSFSGKYFVSEKLKKEIEDAGCTGIEFQPIELSYNEWTAPGGEREKVYGKSC